MRARLSFVFVLALALLQGCVSRAQLYLEPSGYLNCVRLDREPVADELEPRCAPTQGAEGKTGTYHRDTDRELAADVLPTSVPRALADKLPVSDCLWVGGSQFGGSEVLAPQWELVVGASYQERGKSDRVVWQHSACRADRLFPRRSVTDPEVEAWCFNDSIDVRGAVLSFEARYLESWKSTCDLRDDIVLTGSTDGQLLAQSFADDGYGSCEPHVQPQRVAAEWPDTISGCSQVDELLVDDVAFAKQLVAQGDAQFTVDLSYDGLGAKRTLWPRVRTVVDERTIARALDLDGAAPSWETAQVALDARGQRWAENFTNLVRVRRVRVFSVTSRARDDREYRALDDLTLTLVDRADGDAAVDCAPSGDAFDLPACGIDATPTYLVNTLEASSGPLAAPLRWTLTGATLDDAREWYLEFELDSVFRTRTATLQANTSAVDFGEVPQGDVRSVGVTVRNVGSGLFVIDAVDIDPNFGAAAQFAARRLDDAVDVPQPVVAVTDASGAVTLSDGGWDTPYDRGAMRVIGNTVLLPRPPLDGVELDVFGVPIAIDGGTPIVQTPHPDISGFEPDAGTAYPMTYRAYLEWPLPRSLAPNDARRIQVDVRPQQVGALEARLLVSGYPLHAPQARSTIGVVLTAYGLAGPRAEILPALVRLPFGADGHDRRNAVIASAGDRDLIVESVVLEDTGANGHLGDVVNFSLDYAPAKQAAVPPGAAELVTVRYRPGCFYALPPGGEHRARLRITTNAGVHDIALSGDPDRWAQTHACGPGQ